MFKVFMSIIFTFASNFFNLNDKYFLVSKSVEEEREIVNEYKGVSLYKRYDGMFVLEGESFSVIFENEVLYEIDTNVYINDYYNNSFYVYSKNGQLLETESLSMFVSPKDIKIVICEEEVYLIGTSTTNDILFYNVLSKEKVYLGGTKDESLCDALYVNKMFYLVINKDELSEYPFGNGSKRVIAIIDDKFSVKKVIYFSEEIYRGLEYQDSYLYYITDNSVRMFDSNLNYACMYEYSDMKDVFIGENSLILVFCEEYVYLVDARTLKKIENIKIDIKKYKDYQIKRLDKRFYAYTYQSNQREYFDIINVSKLNINKMCYPEYEDRDSVCSVFGKCSSVGREYDEYFAKGFFGKYLGEEEYETLGGIPFVVRFEYEIVSEANVTEGMVYPDGYPLFFNGDGKLDGEYIYNNHTCYGEGEHVLELVGKNDYKKITFYLSKNQIPFVEEHHKEGMEVIFDEDYEIKVRIKGLENYEIKEIVIFDTSTFDDVEYDSFSYENDYLIIKFLKENKVTSKELYLKKIVTKVYNNDYDVMINKAFIINFIQKDIDIIVDYNSRKIKCEVLDENALSRMIKVYLYSNTFSYTFYYPLESGNLQVNNINEGSYNVIISICYDVSSSSYKDKEIVRSSVYINSMSSSLGFITINKYDESLKSLTVDLNNTSNLEVLSINLNNEVKYKLQEYEYEKLIIYFIISLTFSFIFVKSIKAVRLIFKNIKSSFRKKENKV